MSEGIPEPANTNEAPSVEREYNQEAVEQEAMKEAERIFYDRGLDEMSGFEQASALINIMEELAEEGNQNRHVVEALARMTSIVEADNKSHEKKVAYPAAAQALGR